MLFVLGVVLLMRVEIVEIDARHLVTRPDLTGQS